MIINATQFARVQDGASDLIGQCHMFYFAGNAMSPSAVASHLNDMDEAFRKIAGALGYSVEKIEPVALAAAE